MENRVNVTRKGKVLVVVLDRPKANAIDIQTSKELGEAFVTLRDDPELSVGIITGGGEKIFSAGWDLKALNAGEMQTDNWWEDDYGPGGFAGLTELWDLNKPVIAACYGLVIGGGLELAISADFVLVNESAEIGLPELSIGTYVGGGATYLLPQLVGLSKARELIFLGQRITGREAVAIGLATRAFPDAMFAEGVRDFAELLKRSAPRAMAFAKEHLNHEGARTYDTSLDNELEAILACMATRDWREGIEAFAEKRAPVFRGE